MFIRSSSAINDCLIALDTIRTISKLDYCDICILFKDDADRNRPFKFLYNSEEVRDKAFDELCAFLNSNYKLRNFT